MKGREVHMNLVLKATLLALTPFLRKQMNGKVQLSLVMTLITLVLKATLFALPPFLLLRRNQKQHCLRLLRRNLHKPIKQKQKPNRCHHLNIQCPFILIHLNLVILFPQFPFILIHLNLVILFPEFPFILIHLLQIQLPHILFRM